MNSKNPPSLYRICLGLWCALCAFAVQEVRAGLTFDLHLQRGQGGYSYYSDLNTNGVGAALPYGFYAVRSADNNGHREYEYTTNGFNFVGGGSGGFSTFDQLMFSVTNGQWSLWVTNSTLTNYYKFSISAAAMTSNMVPTVTITYPQNGDIEVPNHPNFTWQGPTNFPGIIFVEAYDPTFDYFNLYFPYPPAATTTNWDTYSPDLPNGPITFYVQYTNTATAQMPISTPVNTNTLAALSGWQAGVQVDVYASVDFDVGNTNESVGHFLIAYYAFDDGDVFTADLSGNGYDISSAAGTGGSVDITNDALFGPFAATFTYDYNVGAGWLVTPTNLLSTLAGSFSVSLWIKTEDSFGDDADPAEEGEGIFGCSFSFSSADVIPMSMTGNKLAFLTGDGNTLHSVSDINTGVYKHLVVTRDQNTGQKKIYVDGVLDASETSTTDLLDDPTTCNIGVNFNLRGFNGNIDDIQVYSGVLSASEVDFLYNNPGETVPNTDTNGFPGALDTTNLVWTTGGDVPWFTEATNTYDAVDAAQSGAIGDGEVSWIQTAVPYDGTISYFWKTDSETNGDYLTLYVNDNFATEISGDSGWQSFEIGVASGDVLRWEYAKNGSTSTGLDAAWLDQVVYTIDDSNVSVDFQLELVKSRDRNFLAYDYFSCFPSFISVYPNPITSNVVHSPNNQFNFRQLPNSGIGGESSDYGDFNQVANECTNGLWTLIINQGSIYEKTYQFSVSFNGMTSNVFGSVNILYPTNGASGIPTNSPFHWNGPAGYTTIFLIKSTVSATETEATFLSDTATNWPSPPAMSVGGNRLFVEYRSNSVSSLVQLSTPVDNQSQSIPGWSTLVNLHSTAVSIFTVTNIGVASPVTVSNVVRSGANLQFSFVTQNGLSHTIEARTNLTVGSWTTLSNFTGDGTLKQFTFPTTNPPIRFFRVRTQ